MPGIGRLSYLENIQMPVLLLAIGLIDRMEKWKYAVFLSGFVTSIGIFFCKASHLIPALGLMLALLIYDIFFRRAGKKIALFSQLQFIGGILPVGLFWMFFAYFPTVNLVWDGAISTAFFSTLSGLESVKSYIMYLFTLFLFNKFSLHSPVVILLASLFVVGLILKFYKKKSSLSPLEIMIPICLIFLYGGTSVWEYRPIRYQIVMLPLLSAAAAAFLYYLKSGELITKIKFKKHLPVFIAGLLLLSIFFVSIIGSYYFYYDRQNYNFWSILIKSIFLAAALLSIAIILFFKKGKKSSKAKGNDIRFVATAIVALLFTFFINFYLHYDYISKPQYTIRDSAKSVDMALGDSAYVIGTYAPLLTVDARIRSDTPIWGPDRVPQLNERFPATHIVQNRNGALLRILEEDFPGIKNNSLFLGYLYVRGFYLELWKLPGDFSRYSKKYVNSEFENARIQVNQGDYEQALATFMKERNDYGNLFMLDMAIKDANMRLAQKKQL